MLKKALVISEPGGVYFLQIRCGVRVSVAPGTFHYNAGRYSRNIYPNGPQQIQNERCFVQLMK